VRRVRIFSKIDLGQERYQVISTHLLAHKKRFRSAKKYRPTEIASAS